MLINQIYKHVAILTAKTHLGRDNFIGIRALVKKSINTNVGLTKGIVQVRKAGIND